MSWIRVVRDVWDGVCAYAELAATHAWALVRVLFWDDWQPRGRTLQERYPAAPGAFVTSYSSVDLPEEAFVKCACPKCRERRQAAARDSE